MFNFDLDEKSDMRKAKREKKKKKERTEEQRKKKEKWKKKKKKLHRVTSMNPTNNVKNIE